MSNTIEKVDVPRFKLQLSDHLMRVRTVKIIFSEELNKWKIRIRIGIKIKRWIQTPNQIPNPKNCMVFKKKKTPRT
jgi:hypothetical protein